VTPTEKLLLEVHKSPAIRLADVCEQHLGKNYQNAKLAAARNALPFAVFKLDESQKAPWMVSLSDLAAHIDSQATKAKESWTKSQV
jgi:hypothetical protein